MNKNIPFMEQLITKGIVTADEFRQLMKQFDQDAYRVLVHLQEVNKASKQILGQLWGDSLGTAYVDLDKTLFQPEAIKTLSEQTAKKFTVIPLYQMGDVVTLAAGNPRDNEMIDFVQKTLGKKISTVFSYVHDIKDAIEIQYQSGDGLKTMVETLAGHSMFKGREKITPDQLQRLAGEQSIVELGKSIMLLGVKERASDIHIEPQETFIRVRFRIDGNLLERIKLDNALLAPLVSRLKLLAGLDITEHWQPQDGRLSLKLSTRAIEFRLSSVPTIYGEKIVMRILDRRDAKEVPDLKSLDFSTIVLDDIHRIIDTPNGVFFVTGPTGSGKTTTLYGILNELNTPEVNITTIEDPVEYRMPGINQVQVNRARDLDFANSLRAFLRQD
ncbi:MAG: Flp pilus assembly complex ATPase component TadA, partial [Proteobacteria bacterium]|nr:Flp pilus assembly complex ATPase component TadA [Pseudomonadota bacterium]